MTKDHGPGKNGGRAAPYLDWTTDALCARAQELNIGGRPDMTKDELIAALRDL